ncbi:Vacuolar protein sorting-associated protein 9a [Hypsizygus marmoreus]|uniref:Vacuolar protein sorting-associated protein 9a n=1 Tax=Hypsizygus marmoreus TaxID=39966 RepID=A0A369JTV4_HYPMA|nr:Vacuolar protein sorting-associated protein 9a [Hypsizygus marmoreus]
MDSPAPFNNDLAASNANILHTPASLLIDNDSTAITNPWSDAADGQKLVDGEERPLHTPDPSLFDNTIAGGLQAVESSPTDARPKVSKDVLSQFDPLANLEEEAAKEAWESSEAHPPPPRTPSPSAPLAPLKDLPLLSPPESPQSGSLSSSSFPSLVALARTFSIPTLSRPRPLSLDAAKAVPSPATLSSFASQQDTPRNDLITTGKDSAARSDTPNGSGTASPVPGSREKGEIPFDFQNFLDQMKSRSAEPVSKYLRSFLSNFAKRTFTVNDQVKIINDFLNFIAVQMRACDVWKNASEAEFDNAMEGMEKLVMNRLYEFTFTPQVVHAVPPRPITADDLERDRVLSQRIALFGWIEEKHLDIPEGEGSAGFLLFAEQELIKINHYKAPRDKLICILNCCKVIFGLVRHLKKEEGADSFVPILIFVVLKANPEHLLSNVEFISRFRNPEKLQSEAGYYLSSLMGAVSFIETMDHTSLDNISQIEFEKNVEAAILALPQSDPSSPFISQAEELRALSPPNLSPHAGEESAQPLSLSTPAQTISEDAKRLLQKTGDTISKPLNAIGRIFSEALDGAEGKLHYLPGPFAPFELGRENREQSGSTPPNVPRWTHPDQWAQQQQQRYPDSISGSPGLHVPQTPYSGEGVYNPPIQTPYKPRVRRVPSPSYSPAGSPGYASDETPSRSAPYTNQPLAMGPSQALISPSLLPPRVQSLAGGGGERRETISRTPTPNLDLAGVQAQIDAATEHAAAASRETLVQIFPGVDVEVIEWVLEANEGDLGRSIEALLEMSSGD